MDEKQIQFYYVIFVKIRRILLPLNGTLQDASAAG